MQFHEILAFNKGSDDIDIGFVGGSFPVSVNIHVNAFKFAVLAAFADIHGRDRL